MVSWRRWEELSKRRPHGSLARATLWPGLDIERIGFCCCEWGDSELIVFVTRSIISKSNILVVGFQNI